MQLAPPCIVQCRFRAGSHLNHLITSESESESAASTTVNMAASYICNSLLGLLVLLLLATCRAEKVAIIGGGVGGAAAAYYLHKADHSAEIHMFEREERLGGRIQETTFEGRPVELGGAILNKKNKLSVSLVEELDLETAVPQGKLLLLFNQVWAEAGLRLLEWCSLGIRLNSRNPPESIAL
jgi:hypothetical protein